MRTILLIDDDPQLLRVLQRIMRPHASEWSLVTASDGHEATRLVREQPFDLILTDIHMPGKDGLEMIAEARHAQPRVKIMAMSGGGCFDGADFLQVARILGAHEVIEKPFSTERLIAAIQRLLPPEDGSSETSVDAGSNAPRATE
jgi:YesN/AraC family two-component response regulator